MPSKRRLADKECGYCGKLFRPYQASYRYCCMSCAQRGRHRDRKALPFSDDPKKRFDQAYIAERCTPIPGCGCHIWTGSVTNRGYGQTKFRDRAFAAHRISYEVHKGEIPEGLCVMHKCDTPLCVNPLHLVLGTHADNMADKAKKGRQRPPYSGRATPGRTSKKPPRPRKMLVSDEQVEEIRQSRDTYTQIAEKYGISRSYVGMIRTNRLRKSA